ncbi:hypothetical protein [Mycolicibacterium llatzerense]|uniref:hypothetical protein n=1 Tax=Mycolicibacterium llatzerense TaxID=280871 RepID=UPI000A3EEA07|nr:hypothetical protein [Mycolicibacterium llatzerense]
MDAGAAGHGCLVHGEPTGTIGVDDVVADGFVVGGGADGFCPAGSTIGDAALSRLSPPPPPLLSESIFGGQSTAVGGQALADELPPPGGAQPDPAPKSPAPVQSALAGGETVSQAETAQATTPTAESRRRPDMTGIRTALIAAGCPRTR